MFVHSNETQQTLEFAGYAIPRSRLTLSEEHYGASASDRLARPS